MVIVWSCPESIFSNECAGGTSNTTPIDPVESQATRIHVSVVLRPHRGGFVPLGGSYRWLHAPDHRVIDRPLTVSSRVCGSDAIVEEISSTITQLLRDTPCPCEDLEKLENTFVNVLHSLMGCIPQTYIEVFIKYFKENIS